MNSTDKYKTFFKLKDPSLETLDKFFEQRRLSHQFDSELADDILQVDYDENGNEKLQEFPFKERMRWKNELKGFAYRDQDPLSNKEFAEHEIEWLGSTVSEIKDIHLKQRVKKYLEVCRNIAHPGITQTAFAECLRVTPEKKEQFLERFKEYYEPVKWPVIAAAILALRKDGQIYPEVSDSKLIEAIRDFFSPDKDPPIPDYEGCRIYVAENQTRIEPQKVYDAGLQNADFLA